MNRPMIIAHRGACSFAMENTLPAFKKACEIGCDGLEFDVRLTRDNKVVVFHDEGLKRLFGIDEFVREISYAKLRELTEGRVPLLSDALDSIRSLRLINIELKIDGSFSGILEEMTIRAVRASGLFSQVLFSSFNPLSIGLIKRLRKDARVGFLFDKDAFYKEIGAVIASFLGSESIHPPFEILNEFMMLHYKEWGLKIFCWTVDRREDVLRMMRLGVDGIITNRPERFIGYRTIRKKRLSNELDPVFWE